MLDQLENALEPQSGVLNEDVDVETWLRLNEKMARIREKMERWQSASIVLDPQAVAMDPRKDSKALTPHPKSGWKLVR